MAANAAAAYAFNVYPEIAMMKFCNYEGIYSIDIELILTCDNLLSEEV
ncbi:hypothetical protein [Dethiobacter alkaliphilus]|nr:hypothetical protein [Dethiobacter alkaliphilus]MCW3490751.1 hypothetical protein [Dethiobacter alkaliphilus]